MKTGFALAVLLAMSVQTVMANDIEKVMNKALGSGKGQLFKQASGIGSKFLHSGAAAAPSASSALPATPATPAMPDVTAATPAIPATSAIPAATTGAANPAAASANKSNLKDKLMHRAAVESEKYARKYGDKYLKQGKGQLSKFMN